MSISTASAAARESARQTDGRFGEQARTDPGQLALDAYDEADTCDAYGGAVGQELLDHADRVAHRTSSQWLGEVDPEDLRQDAMVAYLERLHRGTSPGVAVSSDELRDTTGWNNSKAALTHIIRATAARHATGYTAGPDYAGYRGYRAACAEFADVNGRAPNRVEQDRLAEQVRNSYPPRRRPRKGFHRPENLSTVPLQPTGRDGDLIERADAALVHHDRYDSFEGGFSGSSLAEQAHRQAEDGGRAGKSTARRMGFSAVAEARGLPTPAEESITDRRAAAVRRAIRDSGGTGGLVEALRGGRETEGTRAFLSVFADSDRERGREIGDMLGGLPGYADDLVESAVSWSTKRRGEGAE